MTVIRPNSVSGINSITAQADEIKVFKSNGTQGGLIIGGANLNATTGISTLAALKVTGNLDVEGVLTYQDVTNVDSLGIGTFRTGINVSGGQLDVGSNIKLGNAGVITATSFSGDGSNLTGIDSTKIETGNTKVETIDTGSDGHVKITTEGSERLRINSSGQLLVGATGNSTGGISEFSKSVGGGAAGCHITVENTSTNSVNNTAGIHLKTDTGTAKFFKYSAAQTFIQSAAGGASELNLQASGAHAMRFFTNSNERFRITSDGELVIGMTAGSGASPDARLQVRGDTYARAKMQVLGTHNDDNPVGLTLAKSRGSGNTILGDNDDIGQIDFAGNDGNGFHNVGRIMVSSSGEGNGNDDLPSVMRFFTTANGGVSLTERMRISSGGNIGIGNRTSSPDNLLHVHTSSGDSVIHVEAAADPKIRLRAHSGESIVQFADAASSNPGEINYVHSGDYLKFRVNAAERMRIRSDGHLQLQQGLTGLSGGGVIVCAAKSSSGTANQSNYKVDFVVPMADLGSKQEYEDIQAQFSSGQTGKDYAHNRGGSGILIATVQNDYYWGFRTKIYHITTYGNNSNNVTQLNLLHNYSAAGHGANSASVDLTVQSHDGKTPTLRGTFSGDYWNSNILTVTYIGSAVASTGNIRQLTAFDSKLTGQDPTWK